MREVSFKNNVNQALTLSFNDSPKYQKNSIKPTNHFPTFTTSYNIIFKNV